MTKDEFEKSLAQQIESTNEHFERIKGRLSGWAANEKKGSSREIELLETLAMVDALQSRTIKVLKGENP